MKQQANVSREDVTIKFAGDSGDGMQLTGNLFTQNTAFEGNALATFPDYPSEIRAPIGTVWGVSGFQIHFGSQKINTPGDQYDVLVAMNAAALKSNLSMVKEFGGTIIVNSDGFDKKNLRLAEYDDNPLDSGLLEPYDVLSIPVTKLTTECLKDAPLGKKEKERSKNMFVLGFLLWRYNRSRQSVLKYLEKKFGRKPDLLKANIDVLNAGYYFGDTHDIFTSRYTVPKAKVQPGTYRGVTGTLALVYGLISAGQKSGLSIFYGSYPITPASDILHTLSGLQHFDVKTFQAEDEIAAIGAAIGAAYGGSLAVTGTSGPGLALKSESIGLAFMLELPLVVLNIQRGGPSTGLPTKTEQADLFMAMYGRSGESPVPVLAAAHPADAFETAFEACRIAIEHMTPVILLSDGYINNGAVPWRIPNPDELPEIHPNFATEKDAETGEFLPYKRDNNGVRKWAIPGTPGLMHHLGGLEKEHETGRVSYDPENHHFMVNARQQKVQAIAESLPGLEIILGSAEGDVLVLGWGSTYGVIQSVVNHMYAQGHKIGHVHLRHIVPLPANTKEVLSRFRKIIIPEINNGQLARYIQAETLLPVMSYTLIKGRPIFEEELMTFIAKHLDL